MLVDSFSSSSQSLQLTKNYTKSMNEMQWLLSLLAFYLFGLPVSTLKPCLKEICKKITDWLKKTPSLMLLSLKCPLDGLWVTKPCV